MMLSSSPNNTNGSIHQCTCNKRINHKNYHFSAIKSAVKKLESVVWIWCGTSFFRFQRCLARNVQIMVSVSFVALCFDRTYNYSKIYFPFEASINVCIDFLKLTINKCYCVSAAEHFLYLHSFSEMKYKLQKNILKAFYYLALDNSFTFYFYLS